MPSNFTRFGPRTKQCPPVRLPENPLLARPDFFLKIPAHVRNDPIRFAAFSRHAHRGRQSRARQISAVRKDQARDHPQGDALLALCRRQADAPGPLPRRRRRLAAAREADALPLACAVECIHTYSLIHDDLPAMDNDDFRRGKPTNHKVFGEGIAVLAGDALLTQAFEIAAQAKGWPRYPHRDLILEIAKASGSLQLVAGQVADLEGEGKKISASELRYIHERKTSALLCCSVRLGGMSANCTPAQLKALTDFGYHVGLAFQVIDDILDVTQTSEQLGKTAGKDTAAQKATYPAIVGLEKSRKIAEQLTAKAFAALKTFKGKAVALEALAEFLLKRDK